MSTRRLVLDPRGAATDLARGSIYFVGTATVLIRYAGYTVLTDPNFLHKGQKVYLGYGVRSARLTEPALEIDQLPELDLIVLSHMHEDHWDRVADTRLDRGIPVVTTPHAAESLANKGFTAPQALSTWETIDCAKPHAHLRITSMPARHGPQLVSRLLPPVMGSMLEFEAGSGGRLLRLYITGDTLVHDRLDEIRVRYSDIDLALLHLGGTRVLGILLTMDGRQGVEAMRMMDPALSIPIHYNDYTVFKSPLSDFRREVQGAGLEDRVHYLAHGETYTFDVPSARYRPARPA